MTEKNPKILETAPKLDVFTSFLYVWPLDE